MIYYHPINWETKPHHYAIYLEIVWLLLFLNYSWRNHNGLNALNYFFKFV